MDKYDNAGLLIRPIVKLEDDMTQSDKLELDQLRVRVGEMAAEIERLNAAQQSPAVAAPDDCLKRQDLPIEKLIEKYADEGCDFTDIAWVNAASLRYLESMEDSQLKCLIYSLINFQSPRITEQDALEPLPYWKPCNPACDTELGQGRDRLCKCQSAIDALKNLIA